LLGLFLCLKENMTSCTHIFIWYTSLLKVNIFLCEYANLNGIAP